MGLLGEDRGAEFTLDKLADMDIDYEAAMQTRQEVRENLLEQLAAKRAGAPAAEVTRPGRRGGRQPPGADGGGRQKWRGGRALGHAREFLVYEASPKACG